MSSCHDDEELERIRAYGDFTTIDWVEDSILERNRRIHDAKNYSIPIGPRGRVTVNWLLSQFWMVVDISQNWFVVSLVGICIGLNAALLSIVTKWLSDIKMGYCSDGWWLNQQFCCWEIESEDDACVSWHAWSSVGILRWMVYTLFAGIFSFVAAHLVKNLARYAAGSGISEIKCIIAGFTMKGFLGLMTLFIKSVTLPLVIASGLSVGKEGPSVHVACCIGFLVAGLFKKFKRSEGQMRELITAASAAGVAVAFGSPIGGVLFSIEEMNHRFEINTMWRSFFCALMATFTLAAMNPFRTGKLVLFQVTYDRDWHFFEIIFYVILGVFGGLYGAFVIKFNLQMAAFRRKHLAAYGVAEAVFLAVLTAVIGYSNQFIRIDMTESMAILFRECESGGNYNNLCDTSVQWRMVNSLLLATVLRTGLVIVSYGSKVPAGIFVPSMAIGATFGRMVGIMVKAIYRAYPQSGVFAVCDPNIPCITPGTYAFLGAAAALSGVMRITVTVVVIMFELTGALTYILPTMIVLLVTRAVGDFLGTNGIAEEMIKFNGYPLLEKEELPYNVTVSAVMRRELHVITETGMAVSDIETLLANTKVNGFPIVSNGEPRMLVGRIGRPELYYVLEKARKMKDIHPDTPCSFVNPSGEEHASLTPPTLDLEAEEEVVSSTLLNASLGEGLQFWPWVNQTPITVSPQQPLDVVMQLFNKMGPRVIFIEKHGTLVGLVTVKDVMRFMATERPSTPILGSPREAVWETRGGLDELLEDGLAWVSDKWQRISNWRR